MDKAALRKIMSEKRNNLSTFEVDSFSETICKKIVDLPQYESADVVFAYMSAGNEVKLQSLMERAVKDGKQLAVPKTYAGFEMDFIMVDDNTVYKEKWGIKEPVDGETVSLSDNTVKVLMIMPGLAFSENGVRVGYGAGFYDRYLEKNTSLVKIAVCYDFQIVKKMQADEYDIAPDILISPKKIIRFA